MFGTLAHFSSLWESSSVKQPGRNSHMNATQLAKTTNGNAVEELDVLVVGAGFAGLYQLDRMRRLSRPGPTSAASGTGTAIRAPGSIRTGRCISSPTRSSGGIGTTASSIPRGRSFAPISTTSTRSSVSAVTSGSTPASRAQSSTRIATSGSCRPATAA
jgi:hypothetical protein